MRALDLMVVGLDRETPGRPETYFAVEISRTLEAEDVERAEDRARILTKLGLRSRAAVGGKFATPKLLEFARSRGVDSSTLLDEHPFVFVVTIVRLVDSRDG
jgi:hypothetical protein